MSPKIINAIAIDDHFRKGLVNFYRQQRGGGSLSFPVYRGLQYQYGTGIGDIFRSIGRFLLPILSGTAAEFIRTTGVGLHEGKTFKDAAKSAIPHVVTKAIETGLGQMKRRSTLNGQHSATEIEAPLTNGQSGGGRRRRRRRGNHAKTSGRSGSRKRKAPAGRGVYKKAKRRRRNTASLRFLKTNF